MFGKCSALLVLLSVIVVAHGAPRKHRRSTLPPWHHPCGENYYTTTEENMVDDCETGLKSGLQLLTSSNALALNNYFQTKYEELYSQVSNLPEHQYKQNWVPGKKDVKIVMDLVNADPKMVAEHLPKLHTDLQKFVVAFEELVEDETRQDVHNALVETRDKLMMDLCEVEVSLMSMCLKVPERVSEDIMTGTDKDPEGETKRLVRDWGILFRYGEYLSTWAKILHY